MNDTLNTQQQLVNSVTMKIDKASFRQCYERCDPAIKFVVIISPEWPMAELVASLLDGGSGTKSLAQLGVEGVVRIVPPVFDLQLDCITPGPCRESALVLRKYLIQRLDQEVMAFYCPPGFFVQFTGKRRD